MKAFWYGFVGFLVPTAFQIIAGLIGVEEAVGDTFGILAIAGGCLGAVYAWRRWGVPGGNAAVEGYLTFLALALAGATVADAVGVNLSTSLSVFDSAVIGAVIASQMARAADAGLPADRPSGVTAEMRPPAGAWRSWQPWYLRSRPQRFWCPSRLPRAAAKTGAQSAQRVWPPCWGPRAPMFSACLVTGMARASIGGSDGEGEGVIAAADGR